MKTFSSALCAILSLSTSLSSVIAAPAPQSQQIAATLDARATPQKNPPSNANDSPSYWMGQAAFHSNYAVWGNPSTTYPIYRNVRDYGAKGDGTTDDTAAINAAMNTTAGAPTLEPGRCTDNCNSSTISPAIVFFPKGTYRVSYPIQMPYYTQVIGDINNLPIIQATEKFTGMAVFDADPYDYTQNGRNWYINQNNFFRQMRNLNIDLTKIADGTGAGIHWQVAQATSLQNIVFNMKQDGTNTQQGIFMDNGSGGYMADLVFNGGKIGAFFGSQQFTTRNMTFNNCRTAVFMNWNWGWTLSGITVSGDNSVNSTGVFMAQSPQNQTAGSMVLADSKITGVKYGVQTAFNLKQNVPATGGTLILNNVDLSGATAAGIIDANGTVVVTPQKVNQFVAGSIYDNSPTRAFKEGLDAATAPNKPAALLDNNGNIYSRSKPQYAGATRNDFLFAIADGGLAGDASTDDTAKMQAFLDKAASQNKIAYFEHAVYKVTNTITVPVNGMRIVGEIWPVILASGFNDVNNPKPVWQIGANDGVKGVGIEITDMLFEVLGPNPGAIVLQWNAATTDKSKTGMWDTHVRMGGSYGTELLLEQCDKRDPLDELVKDCQAAFMMFYATPGSGNILLDNTWFWVADHDMEDEGSFSNKDNRQTSIFNARGVLIRSQGPVWLWGTASEHSVIYNYQFENVKALFSGFMQTETPYMQPVPQVPQPFSFNTQYDDPTFTICRDDQQNTVPCRDAWGLRVFRSSGVLIYSAGLYSFFNDYTQQCVQPDVANCQLNMVRVQDSEMTMYALTTIGTVNMIVDQEFGDNNPIKAVDNRNVYGSNVGYFRSTRR
ncbi:glycoside hydrolase family 55 protein [Hortaea werneckii]|nr:glycoside hydrolase family 55 protein [Hortaea werneckii]